MITPSLDEFLKLAGQGNLIPVATRILADIETPLTAYRKIRGQGESFLFESVEDGEHLGRYSFVGCNPRAVIKQTGSRVEVIEGGKVVESHLVGAPASGPAQSSIAQPAGSETGAPVRDGLEVVERVPTYVKPNPHNVRYLMTKVEKMGHMLPSASDDSEAPGDAGAIDLVAEPEDEPPARAKPQRRRKEAG